MDDTWNPRIYDEILTSSSARWQHAGLPRRVERLTGALARHVPARDRVADWRLAA
jgi:hypothetical protein